MVTTTHIEETHKKMVIDLIGNTDIRHTKKPLEKYVQGNRKIKRLRKYIKFQIFHVAAAGYTKCLVI